ncbi:MAG TPA: zinc-binding alcohol dehydrogenase family protein [Acidimicrobiales bacterium]|nr:zinc-binding alcohol dehydrogenase family protein [Acidimicrobiales bacterium]
MQVQAARLHAHGEPLIVEEIDLPAPSAGEVVVDMAFGGVNPVDRYAALGRVAPDGPLPRTLGAEGSGVVGGQRRVVVRGHGLGSMRDGLWATQAVVPAGALIEVPDGVSLEVAAAMGVAGVTAWRTVTELAEVTPDDRVLVLGASGGVGSMIVSIVHHIGATVWGQTGAAAKEAFVAGRGAEHVCVTPSDDLRAFVVELAALRPTVVFDPLGGPFFGAAIEAMAPRGRLIAYGTSADATGTVPLQMLYRKSLRVIGYGGLMETDEAIAVGIIEALRAVADGRFEVCIDSVLSLSDVNEAFARLVDRSVQGKLLLELGR